MLTATSPGGLRLTDSRPAGYSWIMVIAVLILVVLATLANESRLNNMRRELKGLRARVDELELATEKPNPFLGGDDE
jgi:hypothetical protein